MLLEYSIIVVLTVTNNIKLFASSNRQNIKCDCNGGRESLTLILAIPLQHEIFGKHIIKPKGNEKSKLKQLKIKVSANSYFHQEN